ncbi:DNA-binding LacI/PurR family transcriptional regulator [Pelomonas saccharophila]|uniref:DNA-binding LacI/PurR family transcriptional regulator n=1 Tax=Roseateles saccharophilus TaxID=304 RepID=A0ABU1YEZ1_ROSSA|nr:LacI family DNA-binding transcriptional regulator [Roseateles saccharophilus]MDR7267424.1 DNA-binding LacI/PurR family transcriptional regulator [Roseateles saccharophilus]
MPDSKPKPAEAPAKILRRSSLPTLADVAREAGVSKMAASSALNGGQNSARVSAETRERVLAAAQRLQYRPNANALALTSRRTNAIGFITTLMGKDPNAYFLEVFGGVIQGAMATQQTTAVFTLSSWDEAPTRIPALCDGRVDGLIVLAPRLEDDGQAWLPQHTPMVSVHASGSWRAGGVNFETDDEAGAYEMVRQMFALGHRRILHVGGPAGYPSADSRANGYLRAHADAGVALPPDHVLRVPFTTEGGREAMQAWLQRHRGQPLPEAVFGGSDAIAIGCMEALVARGLNVPRDISVVGFDHTLLARTLQMAAVRQPLHEMGHQAVEVLVQLIEASRRDEAYAGPSNIVLLPETVAGRTLTEARQAPLLIS